MSFVIILIPPLTLLSGDEGEGEVEIDMKESTWLLMIVEREVFRCKGGDVETGDDDGVA